MEQAENPGRERILSRIRAALATPAPMHAGPQTGAPFFAPVDDSLSRFQNECAANITECLLTSDIRTSAEALRAVLESVPAGEVFIEDVPLLRRMAQELVGGRPVRWSSEGPPEESTQATITGAEFLIASTGSVLVTSRNGGRSASVLAPVHIVVGGQAQLEPDLETAFAHAQERGLATENSCLCLISGSSRTADIEKILVRGAHGPRRLVVILAQHLD